MSADREATTIEMANVLATALGVGDLAVAAEDPPAPVPAPEPKPEPAPKPEPTPTPEPPSALAETQKQLASLAESMGRLTESLASERARTGEATPQTPSELEKLSKDPQATEEARLVAAELLGLRDNLKSIQAALETRIQADFDREYAAEKATFAEKYPKFTTAEVNAIDKAFGDAVERNPALADALTFEEFAVRHLGGYEPLLARRAKPNSPRGEDPVVPGGKPPAKIVGESATGGGRASLGKPLDRHATTDDVAARIGASLSATR